MARKPYYDTQEHEKTLILGIHAPYNRTKDIESYFAEFRSLVKTNRNEYDAELYLKLRTVDNSFFITRGKIEEIKQLVDELGIKNIIVSESLTAQQERNLSEILDCNVYDRTYLILEIFEKAAHSAEGKKQVAIAQLQYQKPRVAGKGIMMSQQSGVMGSRGPGETAKERELRHINQQIHKLKDELKELQKTRATQRKKRLEGGELQVALIGYTNAGKSTILNALTKSNVLAEDKLFATLDTTTRELWIGPQKIGLISDTVGFIQLLPHQLIDAFKSTLAELSYADLLLHVIDASDMSWPLHIKVVHEILDELKINKPMLYIFNKIDNVEDMAALRAHAMDYQPHVLVSSLQKADLQPLLDYLITWHATATHPNDATKLES
jgi:GTP-binding protein HflX